MSKKKRQQAVNQNNVNVQSVNDYYQYAPQYASQCPVPTPEVVNMDELAIALDDELFSRLNNLENDRLKVIEARFDPTPWEVEIAYLRREVQLRKVRRELHEQYLAEHATLFPDQDFVEFDDSKYNNAAYN